MIDVNKVIIPDKQKLLAYFSKILEAGKLTNNGDFVSLFENKLSEKLGTVNSLAVCNGTLALHLAVKSLPKKGEIVTTPFSCIASTSSIIWEGNKPIFCDIDKDTYCIDPKLIEEKITEKTVAILGVHVYGNVCNIEAIDKIAKKYDLKVIYDGAHAFGSFYKGTSVFKFGDVTTLSLHAYKIVSSIEGGAIFCKNEELFEKLYKMRYFGKNRDNLEEILGTNAKMSEFSAAYGVQSLMRAEIELEKRKEIALYYTKNFKNNKNISLQKYDKYIKPNFSYYPVILKNERTTIKILEQGLKKNIIFRRYFYPAINTLKFVKQNENETPIALDLSKRIICIPINSSLKNVDLEKIVNLIIENA